MGFVPDSSALRGFSFGAAFVDDVALELLLELDELELELVEPSVFVPFADGAAARFVHAALARASG